MASNNSAIIQARMGSTRLPGKMMLPLDGVPTIARCVERVQQSDSTKSVTIATSTETQDDILVRYGKKYNARIFRGNELDVLDRMHKAASEKEYDIIIRITGDCPLIDPTTIDKVVEQLIERRADYATNTIDRTFPRGLDVEAFTFESFKRVHKEATQTHHREHVTPYYRENPDEFDLVNVTSDEVFDDPQFQNRDDLRLTLDEADDYEVLKEIYENVPYDDILPIRDAIRYVDENNLMGLNKSIEQKEL